MDIHSTWIYVMMNICMYVCMDKPSRSCIPSICEEMRGLCEASAPLGPIPNNASYFNGSGKTRFFFIFKHFNNFFLQHAAMQLLQHAFS
jgi:hypothetical protein